MSATDTMVTLYDKDTKKPSVGLILTVERYEEYQNGDRDFSDARGVGCMLDLKRIKLAEF